MRVNLAFPCVPCFCEVNSTLPVLNPCPVSIRDASFACSRKVWHVGSGICLGRRHFGILALKILPFSCFHLGRSIRSSLCAYTHFCSRPYPISPKVHDLTLRILRILPVRREILLGILYSDLIGFHTYDYARHFLSSCTRILGLPTMPNGVEFEGRLAHVGTFPIGIDPDSFIDVRLLCVSMSMKPRVWC